MKLQFTNKPNVNKVEVKCASGYWRVEPIEYSLYSESPLFEMITSTVILFTVNKTLL